MRTSSFWLYIIIVAEVFSLFSTYSYFKGFDWVKDFNVSFVLPFLVAIIVYYLVSKRDEYRKRREFSILGVVIIESLMEEVEHGIQTMQRTFTAGNLEFPTLLPRKSWDGMNTIPNDVLLRIIEVSRSVIPVVWSPREIRIHTKNYFDHITLNWTGFVATGADWQSFASRFELYLPPSQGVLKMLKQTKDLLEENSERQFPV